MSGLTGVSSPVYTLELPFSPFPLAEHGINPLRKTRESNKYQLISGFVLWNLELK